MTDPLTREAVERLTHELSFLQERSAKPVRLVTVDAADLRAVLAALSPAPQPEQGLAAGWRPIETAPKDGTFADLWHRDQGRVANCRWLTNALGFTAWHAQQGGRGWNMGEDDNFTHWMPLPASPSNPTTTDQGEDGR